MKSFSNSHGNHSSKYNNIEQLAETIKEMVII